MLIMCVTVLIVTAVPSIAQNYTSRPSMDKVKLSKRDTDKGALAKGVDLYTKYWNQFDAFYQPDGPEYDKYARYLKLKPNTSEKRFIVLYQENYMGGVCAPLGCEISLFENYEGNKWRYIMHVFANEIFISRESNNGYYDIYIRPGRANRDTNKDNRIFRRLYWNGVKYVSALQENRKDNDTP